MAIADSTATTHKELGEQLPLTFRPFAVWFNDDPGCNSRKWTVNDAGGDPAQEFSDLAAALSAAAEASTEWYNETGLAWHDEANKQAQVLAQINGFDTINATIKTQAANEYVVRMDAFFDLAEREISQHNSTDFDGIAFLLNAAKSETHRFSRLFNAEEVAA